MGSAAGGAVAAGCHSSTRGDGGTGPGGGGDEVAHLQVGCVGRHTVAGVVVTPVLLLLALLFHRADEAFKS